MQKKFMIHIPEINLAQRIEIEKYQKIFIPSIHHSVKGTESFIAGEQTNVASEDLVNYKNI